MEMNREKYSSFITDKLTTLAIRINVNGKLNQLNTNVQCEYFYAGLLNLIFDLNLKSSNTSVSNYEAIDLVDDDKKICVQVSSNFSNKKIEDALNSQCAILHSGYHFIFVCIVTHCKRATVVNNLGKFIFDIKKDFYDVNRLAKTIQSIVDIDKLKKVYDLVLKELGEPDQRKLDSDLTKIVTILANQKVQSDCKFTVSPYEVDRKISFNDLGDLRQDIKDLWCYHGNLEEIYDSFSQNGENISERVFSYIHFTYISYERKINDSIQLFETVVDSIRKEVLSSANLDCDISNENIYYCARIIAIDCFVRCKIFKNPEEYNYDTSR